MWITRIFWKCKTQERLLFRSKSTIIFLNAQLSRYAPLIRTHCTAKKSWRKTPPAWPDDAVLKYQGDVTLFRHADQVNPTSSDNEDGIFRGHWHSAEFSDNFPTTFRQFSVNFPTNENQKCHHRGSNLNPSGLLPPYHCATPTYLWNFMSSFVRSVFTVGVKFTAKFLRLLWQIHTVSETFLLWKHDFLRGFLR